MESLVAVDASVWGFAVGVIEAEDSSGGEASVAQTCRLVSLWVVLLYCSDRYSQSKQRTDAPSKL